MNNKILVLQIEDRTDNLLNKLLNENKKICQANGIEYVFMNNTSSTISAYWRKVFEINNIMKKKEYDNIDYIMWLDSDAFLFEFTKEKLNNLLEKNKDYSMLITPDMPEYYSKFCAGVFMIKNNKEGKKIIDKWISLYNPNDWKYDTEKKKWITDKEWAGVAYEQGSFTEYILTDEKFKKDILILPYYVFNNNSCSDYKPDKISTHLKGHLKADKKITDKCEETLKYKLNQKENFESHYNNNFKIIIIILIILILLLILIFFLKKKVCLKLIKNML